MRENSKERRGCTCGCRETGMLHKSSIENSLQGAMLTAMIDWVKEGEWVRERDDASILRTASFPKALRMPPQSELLHFHKKNLCVLHPPRKIITVAVAYTDQSIHLHSSFASHKVRNRRVRKFWKKMINYWAYLWWWLQDVVGCFHNFTMINGG